MLGFIELRILLLCGSDLLESFCIPGLWNESDVSIGNSLLHKSYCTMYNINEKNLQEIHSKMFMVINSYTEIHCLVLQMF